jgi:hypothetical protein
MDVNISAIKDLLLPGLRGIEGKYEQIPAQYDKIFTKHDSKMALERTAEMRFLGLAQLKTEGGQTSFDNGAGERFVYNQEHVEIALGYAITRIAPPAHWCRGMSGTEAVQVAKSGEVLIIKIGERSFSYGTEGLRQSKPA